MTVAAREADFESLKRVLTCNKWKKHEIDQALGQTEIAEFNNKRDLLLLYRDTGRVVQSHT